jgi:hypothetical protein
MALALSFALSRPMPVAADEETASALALALFREGRALVESGRISEACPKFRESLKLEFALGTLLNLAECEAAAGRTATAWARFGELEERARRAGQTDRESYAKGKKEELALRLPKLEIQVVPAGTKIDRVVIDDAEVGPESLGTPLPVNPGEVKVTVWSGRRAFESSRTIPDAAGTYPLDLRVEAVPTTTSEPGIDGRAVAGWTLFALGLAGVGVGTYFGARAIELRDESNEGCTGTTCTDAGLAAFDDGRFHADGATVAFSTGGPILAAGIGILIWTAVSPTRGAAEVGLLGQF